MVLTGLDDSELAIKAVSEGAQDYLVKGQLDNQLVVKMHSLCIRASKAASEAPRRSRRSEKAQGIATDLLALQKDQG